LESVYTLATPIQTHDRPPIAYDFGSRLASSRSKIYSHHSTGGIGTGNVWVGHVADGFRTRSRIPRQDKVCIGQIVGIKRLIGEKNVNARPRPADRAAEPLGRSIRARTLESTAS
jgi:hypothetical protein